MREGNLLSQEEVEERMVVGKNIDRLLQRNNSMALRIALAQINATVGDLSGNPTKILEGLEKARQAGAGLVAFPELAVTGYPPEDLLLKPDFVELAQRF